MSAHTTHRDWMQNDPSHCHVPQTWRSAASSGFSLLKLRQPAGGHHVPPSTDFTLQLALTPKFEAFVDHRQVFTSRGEGFALSPVGTALAYETTSDISFLLGVLPKAAVRTYLEPVAPGGWTDDFGERHARTFQDGAVAALLHRLWDEADRGSPGGALFADSAWHTILLALLEGQARAAVSARLHRGGLAPWQLKRVQEALEDRLGADLSLADLAGEVGLSEAHLSRAFKASTGLPPWRWQAERRVERAKALLADPRLSLTDVAQMVGYAGQSTFGEAFRRATGATPGQYRREVLR